MEKSVFAEEWEIFYIRRGLSPKVEFDLKMCVFMTFYEQHLETLFPTLHHILKIYVIIYIFS